MYWMRSLLTDMARKKGTKNKKKNEKVAVIAVEPESIQLPDIVPTPERFFYPVYEGVAVTEVLSKNKNLYHCEGKDKNGNVVTLHVPKKLFV